MSKLIKVNSGRNKSLNRNENSKKKEYFERLLLKCQLRLLGE